MSAVSEHVNLAGFVQTKVSVACFRPCRPRIHHLDSPEIVLEELGVGIHLPRIPQSARGPLSFHRECHREIPNLVLCVDKHGRCQASKASNFAALERQRVALRQGLAMIRRLAQIRALAQDLHQERAKRSLMCSWVWMQHCQNRIEMRHAAVATDSPPGQYSYQDLPRFQNAWNGNLGLWEIWLGFDPFQACEILHSHQRHFL